MKVAFTDTVRFHFHEHGLFYGSLFVCLVGAGLIFAFVDTGGAKYEEVRKWRQVDAKIVSSEVREVDSSDDTNFSTKLTANVRFEYPVEDGSELADYKATWTRRDHRNWSEYLAKGKKLKIRVSPHDPGVVSLLEHNGKP